jgi:predicted metal-dependent enzyme (double-stranded beta helix superfamily)
MYDIDELVARCVAAQRETQPALATKEVVARAVHRPADLDAALGTPGEGALRCLYRSPELTVLQIVWPPGVRLFPHDHRMWAANGIYGGTEDNTFFRRTGGSPGEGPGIEVSGGQSLGAGDVALLGAEAIHSVANPTRRCTAAIHVYGGDFFATPRSQWDPETLEEHPFDVDALRRVLADAADTDSESGD